MTRSKFVKKLIALIPILCVTSALAVDIDREIGLGNDVFVVPTRNIPESVFREFTPGVFDSYGPTLIRWSSDEIREVIPNFVDTVEGDVTYRFNVMFYPNSQGNLNARLDSYFLRNHFSNGRYEFVEGLNAFKVHRNTLKYSWDFLKIEPNSKIEPPKSIDEFWLADCRRPVLRRHLVCRMEAKYRGHYMGFSVVGENLHLRNQLVQFIAAKMDSYMKKTPNN